MTTPKPAKRLLPVLLAGALALTVGALLLRGPAPTHLPVMAEHPVVLPDASRLFVQKYEVSIADWNDCHADGACTLALRAPPNTKDSDMPATGLSYVDATEYLAWINRVTRHRFRLPTQSEWAFMAAEVLPPAPDPLFTDPDLTWASAYLVEPQTNRALRPQGAFLTTSQGIADLNGSVWEWTNDCAAGGADTPFPPDRCPAFYVGGEHIAAMSFLVRDPARGGCALGAPPAHLGLRLVTDDPLQATTDN
jgi:formylglycine-generating enzyme required for sulfatase activity